MVKACSAWNCTARDTAENKKNGITFHQFPKNYVRRNAWALATRREGEEKGTLWKPTKHSYLCSKHFLDKDFEVNPNIRKLRENAIPSVFQFPDRITNAELPVIQCIEKETITSSYSMKHNVADHITNAELQVIQHTPEKETSSISSLSSTEHSYGIKQYYSIEHHVANSLKRKLEALEEKHKMVYNELQKARRVISLQEKKIQILSDDLLEQQKSNKTWKNTVQDDMDGPTGLLKEHVSVKRMGVPYLEQKKSNETGKNTVQDDMDGPTGLLKELVTVKRLGVPYSDEMKMFAKTLRLFSPNGYEFLRKTLNLPSSRTLRHKKEGTILAPAEVCTQTAQVLEEPLENLDSSYKYCMLVVDDDNTTIKKQDNENGINLEYVDDMIISEHNEGNVDQ